MYVPNSGQGLGRLDYRTNDWDPAFLVFLREKDAKKKVCWNMICRVNWYVCEDYIIACSNTTNAAPILKVILMGDLNVVHCDGMFRNHIF